MLYRERWEEWRGKWCWVWEEKPQPFCEVWKEKVIRGKDWSVMDPEDSKLTIATTRIHRLKAAGLKVEMIASDFIRRCIAPLQNKGRPVWEYKNAADVMRLRPGIDNDLTTMGHGFLCHQLFKSATVEDLSAGVVPLCNNSSMSAIIAMMPVLDAHSINERWVQPPVDQV